METNLHLICIKDSIQNHTFDEYQRGLVSIVYNILNKKIGSGTTSKKKTNLNEVLAQ